MQFQLRLLIFVKSGIRVNIHLAKIVREVENVCRQVQDFNYQAAVSKFSHLNYHCILVNFSVPSKGARNKASYQVEVTIYLQQQPCETIGRLMSTR